MGPIDRGAIGEPINGNSDVLSAVVISNDGKFIVKGSWEANIRHWDSGTGEAIGKPMEDHSYWISSLAISTDGNLIVSGSCSSLR